MMAAAYSIAYGREAEHAEALAAGLASLPKDFVASVCGICGGKGAYEQTFTAGCGGGYFRSNSGCDYCDGMGLMQGSKPAPTSVLAQVLNAAISSSAGKKR